MHIIPEGDPSSRPGLALGRMLTALLLLFIFSSGAVVAVDSLAGEKERGTLETLLTTAVGRLEILTAKQRSARMPPRNALTGCIGGIEAGL